MSSLFFPPKAFLTSRSLLRLLQGIVIAGMWPGMTFYLTLFYPPSRIGKRIGYYFTASQVSAAVAGLVSAGFQLMDGAGGLVGFQWMFLLYGLVGIILGFVLLWWLPDRPLAPGEVRSQTGWQRWIPQTPPALTGRDAEIHYRDLTRVYHSRPWTLKDLSNILLDWRLWPLTLMYFGVVGVGIGTQNYGTVIIEGIKPELNGVDLSLLFAPIWIVSLPPFISPPCSTPPYFISCLFYLLPNSQSPQMDLIAILLVTPLSDRFHHHRPLFFSIPCLIQITGLLMTTFAGSGSASWSRYGGLLLVGFGLGPTVPITMTWTTEIFQHRHGEVGVAAASALVSGLGNLGSILTTYALYTGWPADSVEGPLQYRMSNLVMIGILGLSILSAITMAVLLRVFGNGKGKGKGSPGSGSEAGEGDDGFVDGAARRELQERGLGRMWILQKVKRVFGA